MTGSKTKTVTEKSIPVASGEERPYRTSIYISARLPRSLPSRSPDDNGTLHRAALAPFGLPISAVVAPVTSSLPPTSSGSINCLERSQRLMSAVGLPAAVRRCCVAALPMRSVFRPDGD